MSPARGARAAPPRPPAQQLRKRTPRSGRRCTQKARRHAPTQRAGMQTNLKQRRKEEVMSRTAFMFRGEGAPLSGARGPASAGRVALAPQAESHYYTTTSTSTRPCTTTCTILILVGQSTSSRTPTSPRLVLLLVLAAPTNLTTPHTHIP